jgi:hypothetical protein
MATTNGRVRLPWESDYEPTRPWLKEVIPSCGSQNHYERIVIPEAERHEAKFQMPSGLEPSVQAFVDILFEDKFLSCTTDCSNAYKKAKGRNNVRDFETWEILIFFSIVLYMGVVQLPAKADYWSSDPDWPTHPLLKGMSATRFNEIWMNIHFTPVVGELDENDEPEGETEDVETAEQILDFEELDPLDERWYAKAAPLFDRVNQFSVYLQVS